MTTKSLLWISLFVPVALAADAGKDNLHAWFQDGTCVEFFTESTGGTNPSSTSGSVLVNSTNVVHRVVRDGQGRLLFAYDLLARRAPNDTFELMIKPAAPGPTVAAVRNFPSVKRGEAVMVDILQNPATGEKIYDVLRPSTDPAPQGPASTTDEFVLGELQITIDGAQFAWATGAVLTGVAARIYVPGHGAYFLSMTDAPGFHEAAHVNREKLTFQLDHEHFEMTSKKNLLSQSTYKVVWVKHDPAFVASDPNALHLMTADKAEFLMPKAR